MYVQTTRRTQAAGLLEICDIGFADGSTQDKIIVFSGWMFASSPAVSSLKHPVYDVTLLACAKRAKIYFLKR